MTTKETMRENRVTQRQIDEMMDKAEKKYWRPYDNVLVGIFRFENGFTCSETAACVDPENYDEGIGKDIIRQRIENQLWRLEGYLLNSSLHGKGEK